MYTTIWIALGVGYLLTWLLIPWVLLKRTVHASAAVAWILSILFVPYLGALLCVLAGTTRWERHVDRKREATARVNEGLPHWAKQHLAPAYTVGRWAPLAQVVESQIGTRATCGNEVEVYPDTEWSLQQIERIVEEAERFVHIEFYIVRNDETGSRLRDLLIRKAREGVAVKLIYDGFGSLWLGRDFVHPLQEAGVQTASFTPGPNLLHLLTLNLRNHRKIVIGDGQVGLTGGMNIGQEYIRPTKNFGHWRDTQILVRGPAVLQLQRVFAQDWFFATGEALTADELYPEPERRGDITAQVVSDGPDNDVDVFYCLLIAAIGLAQRRVTLTTPYFVPPEGLAATLETAARRGVDVRIMTAGRGNWTWTFQAGRSYYDTLLKAGAKIWEYQRGLYHAKTIVVDGEWSLVGTANCDFRSFILNFEVALATFDETIAAELEKEFEDDLQFARRIDLEEWRRRPTSARLNEEFWRLFAPIL